MKHIVTTGSARTPIKQSWDAYWRGTRDAASYSCEGTDHPALKAFWQRVLAMPPPTPDQARVADIACGNGAVEESIYATLQPEPPELWCVDSSAAAIGALARRYQNARVIVADARALPFRSNQFSLVTSQFGVEYAGPDALPEIARLPTAGGRVALLLHNREGSIYRNCASSLQAIEALRNSGFIPVALAACERGFAALRSRHQDTATTPPELLRAFQAVEAIMMQHGQHVASNLVLRLYNDVARIQRDLRNYEPDEVLSWLRRMDAELPAYAGRMASMCAVSLDRDNFGHLCGELERRGYRMVLTDTWAVPGAQPLAWALIAERLG